jgi:uncharacterized membrane protein YdbT with pleckstrin-like domain
MSFTKEQLLPGETLIALLHQHPIVLLKPVLLNVAAVVVFTALAVYIRWWFASFDLLPLAFLLWEYTVRHKREYIVTDRRVVKQEGVFTVTSFDASLDKINNVFHAQTLVGRLFKYGTVGLETASEQGTTVFEYIPDPVQFKNHIVRQRESYKSPAAAQPPGPIQDIPQMLEQLASLRDRNIITLAEFEAKKKALLEKL